MFLDAKWSSTQIVHMRRLSAEGLGTRLKVIIQALI